MDLINTLESPGEFDAAAKLRPGEPYFLLVGRDRLAPELVQQWADLNRKRALEDAAAERIDGDQLSDELRKSTQAEQIGWSMTSYKRGEVEAPPRTKRPPPTYTGHELPEETKVRDDERSLRAHAASRCANAAAELAEAAEQFRAFGLTHEAAMLTDEVTEMERLADLVRPHRPLLDNEQEDHND